MHVSTLMQMLIVISVWELFALRELKFEFKNSKNTWCLQINILQLFKISSFYFNEKFWYFEMCIDYGFYYITFCRIKILFSFVSKYWNVSSSQMKT